MKLNIRDEIQFTTARECKTARDKGRGTGDEGTANSTQKKIHQPLQPLKPLKLLQPLQLLQQITGCSLVPGPLSLVPGCILHGSLNFVTNRLF